MKAAPIVTKRTIIFLVVTCKAIRGKKQNGDNPGTNEKMKRRKTEDIDLRWHDLLLLTDNATWPENGSEKEAMGFGSELNPNFRSSRVVIEGLDSRCLRSSE